MSTRRVRRVSEESEVAVFHEQGQEHCCGGELRSSGVTTVKCRVGRVGSVLRSELRLKRVQVSAVKMARVAEEAASSDFQRKTFEYDAAAAAFILKGDLVIRSGSQREPDGAESSGFSVETHISCQEVCVSKRDAEQPTCNICRL